MSQRGLWDKTAKSSPEAVRVAGDASFQVQSLQHRLYARPAMGTANYGVTTKLPVIDAGCMSHRKK
jgi:hypothetical protein